MKYELEDDFITFYLTFGATLKTRVGQKENCSEVEICRQSYCLEAVTNDFQA